MLATEQIEDIGGQVDYLNSIKKDKSAHENTRFYALKWLLQCELRKGTAAKAIKLAAEMDGGTLYDREISLDLAMGLFAYQKNKKAAEDVLDKLSLKFTDDNTSEVISKIKSQLVESVIPGEPAVPIQQDQEANSTLSAFPNPFNATARISYRLANAGRISIVIYNILGQQVLKLVDKDLEVGNHEVVWDGKDKYGTMVPSGMYLCRLETMDKGKTIKLLMTK
jgi:hypothetical protein